MLVLFNNCNLISNVEYTMYMYHRRTDNFSQPVLGMHLSSSSSDICYGSSNFCPSILVASCNHSKDVTVECSKYK